MNEGGGAIIGFFLLVGFVLAFGWPAAAIIGIPLAIDLLIGHRIRSQRNFRYLEPIEQALRRASQGFALMAFALLVAVVPYVWLYGWRDFRALGPWFVAHPADAWPLALLAVAFFAGLVRFRAGMQALAGARELAPQEVELKETIIRQPAIDQVPGQPRSPLYLCHHSRPDRQDCRQDAQACEQQEKQRLNPQGGAVAATECIEEIAAPIVQAVLQCQLQHGTAQQGQREEPGGRGVRCTPKPRGCVPKAGRQKAARCRRLTSGIRDG